MNYMVILVVDDITLTPAVMDAWEKAGVPGITVLDSSGLGRLRRASLRDDLPLMPSLQDLLNSEDQPSNTLFSVVADQAMVDRLVESARQVVGDLDASGTGFLVVLPVSEVHGLKKARPVSPGG